MDKLLDDMISIRGTGLGFCRMSYHCFFGVSSRFLDLSVDYIKDYFTRMTFPDFLDRIFPDVI